MKLKTSPGPQLKGTSSPMSSDQVRSIQTSLTRRLQNVIERGDAMLALGLIWLVMLLVQSASPAVLGIDGYYHITMASLIRQHGLWFDFPWLPLTILNPADFTNHHLLYHLLLVPFTIGDLRAGAKAAGLVYGILAIFSAYLLMVRLRIRYPLLWLLTLLGSAEWFIGRQSMTRRQSVSLALLMLASYLLINRRYRWLMPLAFAYAWLFDGYVLLFGIVAAAFVATTIADRELHWPMFGWTLLGLGLSQLAHPFFPNNLTFTYLHLLPKLVPDGVVAVGNEWAPYQRDVLAQQSWLALSLFVAGLLPAVVAPRRLLHDRAALYLGGTTLIFVVLYLRSRRFIETEPAFAAVFCAYVWTHHLPAPLRRLGTRLPRPAAAGMLALVLAMLSAQLVYVVNRARISALDTGGYARLQAASEWLAQNTNPGERVYHTDWDDFPELFFYNTHNTYIVGLDPTYMYLEQPELYLLWRSLGRGEVPLPSGPIRDKLGARWGITPRGHTGFIVQASNDPDMEIVFETPSAVVYRIKG